MKFSLIIPTYNEEEYLPRLLTSIQAQTLKPTEVIVADNKSTDTTPSIVNKFGYRLVPGGSPAEGKNSGASYASSPVLIFMDADSSPDNKNFFQEVIPLFENGNYDFATCFAKNEKENKILGKLAIYGSNTRKLLDIMLYKLTGQVVGASGWFMIIKKEVFDSLSGFDETFNNYEDTDFYKRAVKGKYRFGILLKAVPLSGRRFDKMTIKQLFYSQWYLMLYKLGFEKNLKKYEESKGSLGG